MPAPTITRQNLPRKKPQDRRKHPDRWQNDLNPNRGASQTTGTPAATQPVTRPASEIKRVVRTLQDFTRDELDQVPVVEPGSRLRPRAVYVDLGDPERRPFKATDQALAGEDTFYVGKASVARPFWNRLTRVPEQERDKGIVTREDQRGGTTVARKRLRGSKRGSARRLARLPDSIGTPRSRGDSGTRSIPQGENELRGGRERSERRGAGAVGKSRGIARHGRARPH